MLKHTQVPSLPTGRPETGPMRFGDDWPGVFIRGDNAGTYAHALRNLFAGGDDAFMKGALAGLERLLSSSQIPHEQ